MNLIIVALLVTTLAHPEKFDSATESLRKSTAAGKPNSHTQLQFQYGNSQMTNIGIANSQLNEISTVSGNLPMPQKGSALELQTISPIRDFGGRLIHPIAYNMLTQGLSETSPSVGQIPRENVIMNQVSSSFQPPAPNIPGSQSANVKYFVIKNTTDNAIPDKPSPPFDFSNWSLEIPKDNNGVSMGLVLSRDLNKYTSEYFYPDGNGSAILKASVNGFSPPGEDFVRTVLKQNQRWGIGQSHFVYIKMSVEAMTTNIKRMMLIQLRSNEEDYAFAVAYNNGNLVLVVRGTKGQPDKVIQLGTIQLGRPFTISAEVNAAGFLGVAYNSNTVYTSTNDQVLRGKEYYFRCGAHLQTNRQKGETNGNASGIVRIINANTDI